MTLHSQFIVGRRRQEQQETGNSDWTGVGQLSCLRASRPWPRVLPGWFPRRPDQSQYNRKLRGLVGLISIVQEQLARFLEVGGIRLADGTALVVANYAGCERRSRFAGFARYGCAKSEHRFIWGVRLVLLTDERGLALGYTVVPANGHERQPLVFDNLKVDHLEAVRSSKVDHLQDKSCTVIPLGNRRTGQGAGHIC